MWPSNLLPAPVSALRREVLVKTAVEKRSIAVLGVQKASKAAFQECALLPTWHIFITLFESRDQTLEPDPSTAPTPSWVSG